MKNLIVSITAKILIAIFLCVVISMVMTAFAPHLSNDLALGQLENDDMSWSVMQLWYKLQTAVFYIKAGICLVCGIDCSKSIYKYVKNRKELNS